MEYQQLGNTCKSVSGDVRAVTGGSSPDAPEPRTRAVPDSLPFAEWEGDIVHSKKKGGGGRDENGPHEVYVLFNVAGCLKIYRMDSHNFG